MKTFCSQQAGRAFARQLASLFAVVALLLSASAGAAEVRSLTDVRSRGESAGAFLASVEGNDGYDSLGWIARQTIYHDSEHPSALILPVFSEQPGNPDGL